VWSDHETEHDYLGFTHLVEAIHRILNRDDLLPATIGVYGDWGSGKSSLLKMVAARFSQNADVVVLNLNGWLFEGYDDAKAALMETILDEISNHRSLTAKAKTLAGRLIRRVNWLRVTGKAFKYTAGFLFGGPAGAAAVAVADAAAPAKPEPKKDDKKDSDDDFEKYFKKDPDLEQRRGVREFRRDFQEFLGETKIKTLVVIIDDLDRCLPDTIIETLEAIKLFLFVPRTAFLLGADERLVRYAVRRRFPELPGERAEVGRDYLEKLVQFAIRVPPLSRTEMETYIALLFSKSCGVPQEQIAKACSFALAPDSLSQGRAFTLAEASKQFTNVSTELKEKLALTARLAPVLATGLAGNPRQCKRFLNTLIIRQEMAQSRSMALKERVLAKLMLLEYFRHEAFRKLAQAQAEADGKPGLIKDLEAAAAAKGKLATSTPEMEAWISDAWLQDWLATEPTLVGEDLRPYFYFSRDKLMPISSAAQRLSPQAQEVLQKLIGESEAIRQAALKDTSKLSPADAAAIFEELAERTRSRDDLNGDDSPLTRLFEWSEARKELVSQLVMLIEGLPDRVIPLHAVPRFVRVCEATPSEPAMRKVVERWGQSTESPKLKTAANSRLAQRKKQG
jgi:predicted KAP-like P-loop ATPase